MWGKTPKLPITIAETVWRNCHWLPLKWDIRCTQIPERTEWHNLIFRGRLGEIVEKYVHKGDKLYVEGKIRTRSYDDQAGIKRYVTEIFVDNMEMLTPKSALQPQQPVQQPVQQPQVAPAQNTPADDLPF